MQTLVVGLDAACEEVLDPLFEDGRLPNLQAIFEGGVSGPLESQVPPWTASAWPSLYTGMNPGKHGVFDFLSFDGYDWDTVNATHVRQRTLWDYLDQAGLASVVVNAPVSHPPRPIDGAVVPGYLAPENPVCHPEGILEDVRDAIGDYRVYARRETDERVDRETKFEEYVELTRQRGEAFRYLSDRFDPEFGFVQFQKTDAVFHDFPGDDEKVGRIYEAVDEQVGRILDEYDPGAVVVASDHGIGPYEGYEVRINEVLRREGYAETSTDNEVPSWFQIKDERLVGEETSDDAGTNILERVARLAARGGLTYQRGKAVLERLGLASVVGRHVPVGAVFAASESVSFSESTAYLRSASELGVRLNVAGRDPDGTVTEYESVRREIVDLLAALETPDGEPVFQEVVPREEYIHGPYADEAVDVLCIPADYEHSLSVHVGETFASPEPWNHKPDGVVAIAGSDVDVDAELSGAHLFDVAPTVLATFGIAPDERMDGTALPVVERIEPTAYEPFEPTARTRTDDDGVTARLADLGYLE